MALKREPDLSVVIASFNTRELTRQCLACVRDHGGEVRHETIVVDSASTDGSAEMIEREFPEVIHIRQIPSKAVAGGHAPGMKRAKGRYILLLNPDVLITDGVFSKTLAYMDANPRVGVLGCRLTTPDGSLQPSARGLPGPINKFFQLSGLAARFPSSRIFGKENYSWWDHSTPRKVGWVAGAFFMIRRRTFEELGLPDDGYFFHYKEIDYCLSAHRKYWDVVFYPHASVVHLGGQNTLPPPGHISTQGRESLAVRIASECRYYRKCYGLFRLLSAASVEYLGCAMIRLKQSLAPKNDSLQKKADATVVMNLITEEILKMTKQSIQ